MSRPSARVLDSPDAGAAAPLPRVALAMRQHDGADHGHQQHDARRLEQEQVAAIEQRADRLDVRGSHG